MIHGTGIDIIQIARIRDAAKRHEGFLARIFAESERAYCLSKRNPYPHLAARFAAKEAFIKALAPVPLNGVRLSEIEIATNDRRHPELVLHGETRRVVEAAGVRRSYVSLSHDRAHAVASVILER